MPGILRTVKDEIKGDLWCRTITRAISRRLFIFSYFVSISSFMSINCRLLS